MVLSRRLKKRSITLERLFIQNLRGREIEAQVRGRRRPLFEGHLLDRNIHIGSFEVPEDSAWAGKTLHQLQLRNRFGVHVSSLLRGSHRINIPGGNTILFPSDKIQAIGSDEQLASLSIAIKREIHPEETDIEKREMVLRQIMITDNSPFIGKKLQDSGIRDQYNCMVVGVDEGQRHITLVNPSRLLQAGDLLWIVGEREHLKRVQEVNQSL